MRAEYMPDLVHGPRVMPFSLTHVDIVSVRLVAGEVPSLSAFEEDIKVSMKAYIAIMQAVKTGNLEIFSKTVDSNKETFRKDETLTLILRLRQSVLKTALRNISLSYSKIPFADIKQKLSLGSTIGAEYVCAKSIGDGVIEAVLEHGKDGPGFMQSVAVSDVYGTSEPLDALNQRINFCLEIRNDAVKSMRYPSAKKIVTSGGGFEVRYCTVIIK